jgi:hypothetical protein
MNPVLRVVALAAMVVLTVVLGGCSTPPEQEPNVATLDTTGASPTVSNSVAPTAGRPRERLDMTPEELDEMYRAHATCLAENGYDTGKGESGGGSPVEPRVPDESKRTAAEAACLHLDPLPPWEYDVSNPESADFVHSVVRCLRDKGVRYVEESPLNAGENRRGVSLGGPDNHSESITKGLDLIPVCEKELTNR